MGLLKSLPVLCTGVHEVVEIQLYTRTPRSQIIFRQTRPTMPCSCQTMPLSIILFILQANLSLPQLPIPNTSFDGRLTHSIKP